MALNLLATGGFGTLPPPLPPSREGVWSVQGGKPVFLPDPPKFDPGATYPTAQPVQPGQAFDPAVKTRFPAGTPEGGRFRPTPLVGADFHMSGPDIVGPRGLPPPPSQPFPVPGAGPPPVGTPPLIPSASTALPSTPFGTPPGPPPGGGTPAGLPAPLRWIFGLSPLAGAVDTARTLGSPPAAAGGLASTAEDARDLARFQISSFAAGGGFIGSPATGAATVIFADAGYLLRLAQIGLQTPSRIKADPALSARDPAQLAPVALGAFAVLAAAQAAEDRADLVATRQTIGPARDC